MSGTEEARLLSKQTLLTVHTIALVTLMLGCGCASNTSSMRVWERKGTYVITPPNSQMSLHIPKGSLSWKEIRQAGSGYNPNYFHFQDDKNNLVISGSFRSANSFPGIENFWEHQVKEWKKNKRPIPQDVLFVDIHAWKVIIFDVTAPDSYGAHLSAHWLEKGKWIEIHLSLTSDQKDVSAKSRLMGLLKRIRVEMPQPSMGMGHSWHPPKSPPGKR